MPGHPGFGYHGWMHPNEELLHRFYTAFQRRDGKAMAECYHPEARFSDPAFPGLTGDEPGAMWQMLCERGKDLELEFRDIEADDESGRAHWEAHYTFSGTGRKVHNRIDATFRFQDGKIIEHRDDFDFWAWTRMALGPLGLLMGWTPMVKSKVQRTARDSLDKFMSES